MENSKLLVPVLLSIMNNYKEQVAGILKELKQVESVLSNGAADDIFISDRELKELLKLKQKLKSILEEKEVLLQGFSDIYDSRNWENNHIIKSDMAIH